MAGVVGLLSFVLSIVIYCILIVSSSKTATTHSGNVSRTFVQVQTELITAGS